MINRRWNFKIPNLSYVKLNGHFLFRVNTSFWCHYYVNTKLERLSIWKDLSWKFQISAVTSSRYWSRMLETDCVGNMFTI